MSTKTTRPLYALSIFCVSAIIAYPAKGECRFEKEIPIAGVEGVKSPVIDEGKLTLYIPRDNTITVVDLNSNQVAQVITNAPGINGLALANKNSLACFYNKDQHTLNILNCNRQHILAKQKTGQQVVGLIFDKAKMLMYALDADKGTIAAYEADDADLLKKVPLGGKPSCGINDPTTGRIFCGMADKNEIEVLDRGTLSAQDHWPVAPGIAPSDIIFDETSERLFVECQNNLIAIMDANTGKVSATLPVNGQSHGIAYDSQSRHLFVADNKGVGVYDVANEKPSLSQVLTLPAAQGLVCSGKLHKLYVIAPGASGEKLSPMSTFVYAN